MIVNEDAEIVIEGLDPITCGDLQGVADGEGGLSPTECTSAQLVAPKNCGCQAGPPSPQTAAPQTTAPIVSTTEAPQTEAPSAAATLSQLMTTLLLVLGSSMSLAYLV